MRWSGGGQEEEGGRRRRRRRRRDTEPKTRTQHKDVEASRGPSDLPVHPGAKSKSHGFLHPCVLLTQQKRWLLTSHGLLRSSFPAFQDCDEAFDLVGA